MKNTFLLAIIFLFSQSVLHGEGPLTRYEFTQPQMGVPFRIVIYGDDETEAERVAQKAFLRIEELNAIFSDYDYDSELGRLSRTSGSDQFVHVTDELWRVLERSQRLAELSSGAFDVTLGPATALWRKARREQLFPTVENLGLVRSRTGYKSLVLDNNARSAKLLLPNMRLDLGGIAKGYALDQAAAIVRENGFSIFMIQAGGDMVVGGPPPGQSGWRIEIDVSENESDKRVNVIQLSDTAFATSGDLFQFVELDGKRYSHIVDPRTGVGLTDRGLVHVIADDGMTADSLATTLSVMKTSDGLKLLENFENSEAMVTRKAGEEFVTGISTGFPKPE